MTIKLAIFGEGETEVGSAPLGSDLREGGVALGLLSKAILSVCGFEPLFELVISKKFSDLPNLGSDARVEGRRLKIRNPPLKRKMMLALVTAKAAGADLVLFQRDRENSVNSSIESLWAEAVAESGTDLTKFPRVTIACPCRSTETWLLADIRGVRSISPAFRSPFSTDPEERPPPSVLKSTMEDLLTSTGLGLRALYSALIESIDCERLAVACPSFRSFLDSCSIHCAELRRIMNGPTV